jgi:hypothetical protein
MTTTNQQKKDAIRKRNNRTKESPEQRANRLATIAIRNAARRHQESPEKQQQRLQRAAKRNTENRENETPEKRQERLQREAKRSAENRGNETPENRQERQQRDANRSAENRQQRAENRSAEYRSNKNPIKRKLQFEAGVSHTEISELGEIPNICQFVETEESLKFAYQHFMKTRIGEKERIPDHTGGPGLYFPLRNECHQANVCVACDRFISGTGDVKWIHKKTLLLNEDRLADSDLSDTLKGCYKVFDEELHKLLLSPRARVNTNDEYVCCCQCFDSLRPHRKDKPPPKFAISNKWAIGTLPQDLLDHRFTPMSIVTNSDRYCFISEL